MPLPGLSRSYRVREEKRHDVREAEGCLDHYCEGRLFIITPSRTQCLKVISSDAQRRGDPGTSTSAGLLSLSWIATPPSGAPGDE